jgi:hypothetical protein
MVELSAEALVCHTDVKDAPQGRRWVIGVEAPDFSMHFVVAICDGWTRIHGGWKAEMRFAGPEFDLLAVTFLVPRMDLGTNRFETPISRDVAEEWIAQGVIRPILLQRAYVCPECQAVPIFGRGCRNCGSARLVAAQMIHHFSCAHVGYVDEFLEGGEISCPKCHMRGLVVGADFENMTGPLTCFDCGYSSTELEHVGNCVRCGLRFPLNQALEQEIAGYDVCRLDPMALLDES